MLSVFLCSDFYIDGNIPFLRKPNHICLSFEFIVESQPERMLRFGQLDFKLEAAGGWRVSLQIPHQNGSAFGVVSTLYALKLG